jgi:hypothetical protein
MTSKTVFKNIPWIVIGKIIGVALIIPIGNYLLNHFYYGGYKYNDEKEIEQYYQQYIDNSDTLMLTMPKYGSEYYPPNKWGRTGSETLSFEMRRNKGTMDDFIHVPIVSFYSIKYKKHFVLMYFGYFIGMHDWGGVDVILTVNKDDMQNPEYGTEENPVPVLKAVGLTKSIRSNNKDFDTTYMNEFYNNNVKRYLKYKMSKEEFNKRFKN